MESRNVLELKEKHKKEIDRLRLARFKKEPPTLHLTDVPSNYKRRIIHIQFKTTLNKLHSGEDGVECYFDDLDMKPHLEHYMKKSGTKRKYEELESGREIVLKHMKLTKIYNDSHVNLCVNSRILEAESYIDGDTVGIALPNTNGQWVKCDTTLNSDTVHYWTVALKDNIDIYGGFTERQMGLEMSDIREGEKIYRVAKIIEDNGEKFAGYYVSAVLALNPKCHPDMKKLQDYILTCPQTHFDLSEREHKTCLHQINKIRGKLPIYKGLLDFHLHFPEGRKDDPKHDLKHHKFSQGTSEMIETNVKELWDQPFTAAFEMELYYKYIFE